MRCKVQSFVYYEHRKGEYVLPHEHKYYELIYYIDGEGVSYLGSEKLNFRPSTVVVVRPNEKHDEISNTFSRVYIALFSVDCEIKNMRVNLSDDSASLILRLLKQIQEEYKEEKLEYEEVVSLIMEMILIEIERSISKRKSKIPCSQIVKNAKKFLKENYSFDIDFSQVASSFGYSYDRFRHIFLKEVGKTMNQYLLDIRFIKAKEYLETTNMSVKEIGFSCGFNALTHFINSFRQKMNISPNKYREFFKIKNDLGVTLIDEKPIIYIDTDLGGDCDDAGALGLINILKSNDEVEIGGITHNTSLEYGLACVDSINRYYNNNMELGCYKGKAFLDGDDYNSYAKSVALKFGSKYFDRNIAEESTVYLRKRLSNSIKKVKLVAIGQQNNLCKLLLSSSDDISSFSGMELIKEKVEEVVIMGGLFNTSDNDIDFCGKKYDIEYNIKMDIPSAKYFIENCPVKITFVDFIVGYKVKTLGNIISQSQTNPVAMCYKLFSNSSRESWDLIAVLYAARGLNRLFSRSKAGTVSVLDDGHTIFNENKNGKHSYLILKVSEQELAEYIDAIYDEDIKKREKVEVI